MPSPESPPDDVTFRPSNAPAPRFAGMTPTLPPALRELRRQNVTPRPSEMTALAKRFGRIRLDYSPNSNPPTPKLPLSNVCPVRLEFPEFDDESSKENMSHNDQSSSKHSNKESSANSALLLPTNDTVEPNMEARQGVNDTQNVSLDLFDAQRDVSPSKTSVQPLCENTRVKTQFIASPQPQGDSRPSAEIQSSNSDESLGTNIDSISPNFTDEEGLFLGQAETIAPTNDVEVSYSIEAPPPDNDTQANTQIQAASWSTELFSPGAKDPPLQYDGIPVEVRNGHTEETISETPLEQATASDVQADQQEVVRDKSELPNNRYAEQNKCDEESKHLPLHHVHIDEVPIELPSDQVFSQQQSIAKQSSPFALASDENATKQPSPHESTGDMCSADQLLSSQTTGGEDSTNHPSPESIGGEKSVNQPSPSEITSSEDPIKQPSSKSAGGEESVKQPSPFKTTNDEDPTKQPPPSKSADGEESVKQPSPSELTSGEDPTKQPSPSKSSTDKDPTRQPSPSKPAGGEDSAEQPSSSELINGDGTTTEMENNPLQEMDQQSEVQCLPDQTGLEQAESLHLNQSLPDVECPTSPSTTSQKLETNETILQGASRNANESEVAEKRDFHTAVDVDNQISLATPSKAIEVEPAAEETTSSQGDSVGRSSPKTSLNEGIDVEDPAQQPQPQANNDSADLGSRADTKEVTEVDKAVKHQSISEKADNSNMNSSALIEGTKVDLTVPRSPENDQVLEPPTLTEDAMSRLEEETKIVQKSTSGLSSVCISDDVKNVPEAASHVPADSAKSSIDDGKQEQEVKEHQVMAAEIIENSHQESKDCEKVATEKIVEPEQSSSKNLSEQSSSSPTVHESPSAVVSSPLGPVDRADKEQVDFERLMIEIGKIEQGKFRCKWSERSDALKFVSSVVKDVFDENVLQVLSTSLPSLTESLKENLGELRPSIITSTLALLDSIFSSPLPSEIFAQQVLPSVVEIASGYSLTAHDAARTLANGVAAYPSAESMINQCKNMGRLFDVVKDYAEELHDNEEAAKRARHVFAIVKQKRGDIAHSPMADDAPVLTPMSTFSSDSPAVNTNEPREIQMIITGADKSLQEDENKGPKEEQALDPLTPSEASETKTSFAGRRRTQSGNIAPFSTPRSEVPSSVDRIRSLRRSRMSWRTKLETPLLIGKKGILRDMFDSDNGAMSKDKPPRDENSKGAAGGQGRMYSTAEVEEIRRAAIEAVIEKLGQTHNEEREKLMHEKSETEHKLEKERAENQELKSVLEEFEMTMNKMVSEGNTQANARHLALQAEKNKLKAEVVEVRDAFEQLKLKYDKAKHTVDVMGTKETRLIEQNTELKRNMVELQKWSNDLKANTEKKLNKAFENVTSFRTSYLEQEAHAKKALSDLEKIQGQLEKEASNHAETAARLAHCESELHREQDARAELNGEFTTARDSLARVAAERDTVVDKLEDSQKELGLLKAKVDDLESRAARVSEFQRQLDMIRAERQELKARAFDDMTRIRQLEETVEAKERELDEMGAICDEAMSQLEAYKLGQDREP